VSLPQHFTVGNDMANVEGLNLRGSRYYVRIIIPGDLKATYGKTQVNPAMGTSDRREAVLRATIKRAEWLADFEVKRRVLNATPLETITPELSALLAQRVRASVLANDDRVRSDLPLLAEIAHVRGELDRRSANRLIIPRWALPTPRIDDLSGATEAERQELADLNAYLDGKAAIALAGRNLAMVLPLVQAEAANLGVVFDAQTPGARDALLACLKAYRTAHQEVTQRDAGEVIDTPVVPIAPPKATSEAPKRLRDVFDRWIKSGDSPRSADSIAAMDRALRQFEGQHPKVLLRDITRDMGDTYRAWLLANCNASKTARGRLTAIKTLLKYAAGTLEWSQRHAWAGIDIKAKVTSPRRAVTNAELEALFTTPIHTRYDIPKATQAGQDAAYWLPLLGAYTGARLGELCQLRTVDIQTVEGIPVMVLTDDGEDQRIKSEAGKRTVPIHSELLRLGFMEYAKAMQAKGMDSLWPALPLRKDKPSDYFGRWFKDFRGPLGLLGPGKPTFHYFRHTVRPLMRRAGFSESTQDKVTGHETQGSVGTVVYDHWTLQEIQAAVEAIKYPVLALPLVSPYGGPSEAVGVS
jgi:integrase